MAGFTLQKSAYDQVPEVLRREVQGFANSLEYERLGDEGRDVPGLACAALARFLERFQEAEAREGLSERDAKSLADAYGVIEAFSQSDEMRVQNLVQTEIFENLRAAPEVRQRIEARLGPNAKVLLDDWRRRNAEST